MSDFIVEGAGHSMAYFLGKERYDEKLWGFLGEWMRGTAAQIA